MAFSNIGNDKDFIQALIDDGEKDRAKLYDLYPLNIKPTTDDSPFFFYQNKPKDFFKTLKTTKVPSYIVYSGGILVLSRVLLIGLFMVGLFYIVPMLVSARNQKVLPYRRSRMVPYLLYFSCLGMGFMLLEIVLLQKFLLFLGHPSHTLSTTLFAVLFFSGVGSLYTQRLSAHQPEVYIKRVIPILLLVALLYFFYLQTFLQFFLGYPKAMKIGITVIILMPLSFLMGMPLPLAIRFLHTRFNSVIPWMWGVNGATSVLASIVGVILAMNFGYNFTLLVGCAFYLFAFVVVGKWFRQSA
jgi:hypothetical protein